MVTDDAYKLKEPIIIDETEAEIEIEVLNSLNSENDVPIIPDTHTMMTSQLLDNPNNWKKLLFRKLKLIGAAVVVEMNLHIINKRHSLSKSDRFLALCSSRRIVC